MEQINIKQEIIEIIYKQMKVLEKIEINYSETLNLIKDFDELEKESFELNKEYFSFKNRKEMFNCPENILEMSFINLMHNRLDLLKPIDLKVELGFQRNHYIFISDLFKIIKKSKGQNSLEKEINSLINTYTFADEYLEEIFEKFILK